MFTRLFNMIFRARAFRRDPRGYAVGTLARRTLGGGPLALLAMLGWQNRARIRGWFQSGRNAMTRRRADVHHVDGSSYASA